MPIGFSWQNATAVIDRLRALILELSQSNRASIARRNDKTVNPKWRALEAAGNRG